MSSNLPVIVERTLLRTKIDPSRNLFIHSYPAVDGGNKVRKEYWRIEKRLGGGAYGNVYLQKCLKGHLGSDLRALKAIPAQGGGHHGRRIDWVRELETIMEFSHQACEEYFVKSLGWFQNPQYTYIAMEYLEHGDLEMYLKHNPILPESGAKQICFQLSCGLRYMHGKNFAHRDLKLGNILVKEKPPQRWWVKIGDFGLSKRIEETLGLDSTVKGTPAFMAPELLDAVSHSRPPTDAKPGDMWSLGEITFRMLAGRPVFDSTRALWQYDDGHQDLPSELLEERGCSLDAIDFFRGLMARLPQDRLTAEATYWHPWMADLRAPPAPASSSGDSDLELPEAQSMSFPHELWGDQQPGLQPSGEWTNVQPTTGPLGDLAPGPGPTRNNGLSSPAYNGASNTQYSGHSTIVSPTDQNPTGIGNQQGSINDPTLTQGVYTFEHINQPHLGQSNNPWPSPSYLADLHQRDNPYPTRPRTASLSYQHQLPSSWASLQRQPPGTPSFGPGVNGGLTSFTAPVYSTADYGNAHDDAASVGLASQATKGTVWPVLPNSGLAAGVSLPGYQAWAQSQVQGFSRPLAMSSQELLSDLAFHHTNDRILDGSEKWPSHLEVLSGNDNDAEMQVNNKSEEASEFSDGLPEETPTIVYDSPHQMISQQRNGSLHVDDPVSPLTSVAPPDGGPLGYQSTNATFSTEPILRAKIGDWMLNPSSLMPPPPRDPYPHREIQNLGYRRASAPMKRTVSEQPPDSGLEQLLLDTFRSRGLQDINEYSIRALLARLRQNIHTDEIIRKNVMLITIFITNRMQRGYAGLETYTDSHMAAPLMSRTLSSSIDDIDFTEIARLASLIATI